MPLALEVYQPGFRTVYNLVQGHIRHLEGFPAEVDELAAEAIEDYDEEAPLLSPAQVMGTIH